MTVERIRELLKVHISAAEAVGKWEAAFALLGVLDAIDAELAIERNAAK